MGNIDIDALVMAKPYFLYPTADSKSLEVYDIERQRFMGQLAGHDDEISGRSEGEPCCQLPARPSHENPCVEPGDNAVSRHAA